MYKVIFTDMDGTLLNKQSQISEATAQAIKEAKAKGVHFLPCTGRVPYDLQKLIDGTVLKMDNYISCNGAVVVCDNKVIHKVTVKTEYVKKICDFVIKEGMFIRFYTEDTIYGFDCCKIPDDYWGTMPKMLSYDDGMAMIDKSNILKMTIVDNYPEKLKNIEMKLREFTNNEVHFTYTNARFLEIVTKGENKGKGVKIFCDALGVSTERAIGIGDNENDIALLEACGLPCSVSNGTEAVKKVCKYISPYSNDEDGVKDIIDRFVLSN